MTARDPELIELSALLSPRAVADRSPPTSWRSPDGLRARLSVFRVLDPDVETPDTKRAEAGERVWLRYAGDPSALEIAAAEIRASLQHQRLDLGVRPSRGPAAWSGEGRFERLDGNCWVYVLVLTPILVPPPIRLEGAPYLKVGRSNDVDRRARELNEGLPPALGLKWRIFDAVMTESLVTADRLEQALLNQLFARGLTIGGEFVRGDPAVVVACLHDLC